MATLGHSWRHLVTLGHSFLAVRSRTWPYLVTLGRAWQAVDRGVTWPTVGHTWPHLTKHFDQPWARLTQDAHQLLWRMCVVRCTCRYNYGTTENMVWEGPSVSNNYTAKLSSGPATVTISVASARGDIAERNVDTILLTQNASDIAMRLAAESRPLQLDGLIGTQEGEVFAKIESNSDLAMNITLPLTANKSPL
jgi:hypothetical protein